MNAFQKTAITTLMATLLLIAVGSLVRVSGAGLGCPDWPRCWGSWVPPCCPEQIDKAYLEERGLKIEDFNRTKMWIEYINRLVGVSIGLLIMATFVRSFRYRKTQPVIFWGSLAAVLLVIFEGWLGGQVVRSGLKPGMITLHMVGAVVLLCVLLYITFQAIANRVTITFSPALQRRMSWLAALVFGIICIQMLLGTQVREAIDPYIKNAGGIDRSAWIANIGWMDHVHRSFTWLVLAISAYLVYTVRKNEIDGFLRTIAYTSFILIICQTAFGIALAYGGLPKVFQVLHLFTSSVLICAAYTLWLSICRHAIPAA